MTPFLPSTQSPAPPSIAKTSYSLRGTAPGSPPSCPAENPPAPAWSSSPMFAASSASTKNWPCASPRRASMSVALDYFGRTAGVEARCRLHFMPRSGRPGQESRADIGACGRLIYAPPPAATARGLHRRLLLRRFELVAAGRRPGTGSRARSDSTGGPGRVAMARRARSQRAADFTARYSASWVAPTRASPRTGREFERR